MSDNSRFKFRLWDKATKYMIYEENSIGYYIDLDGNIRLDDGYCNNLILMQCIGLQDKDGKDIYEKDFLLDESIDEHDMVEHVSECWIVYELGIFRETGFYTGYLLPQETVEYKIIGNLYQNPDLLEEKS